MILFLNENYAILPMNWFWRRLSMFLRMLY